MDVGRPCELCELSRGRSRETVSSGIVRWVRVLPCELGMEMDSVRSQSDEVSAHGQTCEDTVCRLSHDAGEDGEGPRGSLRWDADAMCGLPPKCGDAFGGRLLMEAFHDD
jgi:hypothetical protein